MSMKELFLISGLGADRRVFQFLDLSGYRLHHVDWITPWINESIEHYSKRLLEQIPAKKPTLIGVSFGGIMAIEIARQIETEKVILISSVRIRSELPWYFRLGEKIKYHKILSVSSKKPHGFIMNCLFGVKTESEKKLLKTIVAETDPFFLKWAVDKVAGWKNMELIPNVITIHGTKDRIFPKREGHYMLKGGGHFMIVTNAQQVTEYIKKSLS